MQSTRNLLLSCLLFLVMACKNHQDRIKVQVQHISITDTETPPPPPPPPSHKLSEVEMKLDKKTCFVNDGLKYKTTVTLITEDSVCRGSVTSEVYDSGEKQTVDFSGTINSNRLTIHFKKQPPVTGDASEWTDQPWTTKKKNGKEVLLIVFKEKNYTTNKWSNTVDEFQAVDCE